MSIIKNKLRWLHSLGAGLVRSCVSSRRNTGRLSRLGSTSTCILQVGLRPQAELARSASGTTLSESTTDVRGSRSSLLETEALCSIGHAEILNSVGASNIGFGGEGVGTLAGFDAGVAQVAALAALGPECFDSIE